MCVCSLDFSPHPSPPQLLAANTSTHTDPVQCLGAPALILSARLLVTCWHVFIWPCMVNYKAFVIALAWGRPLVYDTSNGGNCYC